MTLINKNRHYREEARGSKYGQCVVNWVIPRPEIIHRHKEVCIKDNQRVSAVDPIRQKKATKTHNKLEYNLGAQDWRSLVVTINHLDTMCVKMDLGGEYRRLACICQFLSPNNT